MTDRAELLWLKCEHRNIEREIAALRNWWESRDPTAALNYGEMGRRVMDLHDRLGRHFTAEEDGRYLERAQETRPELAPMFWAYSTTIGDCVRHCPGSASG